MANWLYSKIGEIEEPATRPPLKTVDLAVAADAFQANTSRMRSFWALNPVLIHRSCRSIKVACEAAFAVTGHLPLTEEERCDPFIRERLGKKFSEIAAKHPMGQSDIDDAINNFDAMIKDLSESESSVVDEAIYATLCSHLTTGWTAFETLAGDLWESALNCHPSTLASLSGSRTRISKMAGRRRDESETVAEGERRQTDFRLNVFERITKGTFNAQSLMGKLLRPSWRFDKLSGIREAYAAAFSKRHATIDALLADKSLDKLNLVRNVILHKAGNVDQKFLDGADSISWNAEAQLDKPIPLDGQIVKELLTPVFRTGWELVYAVDAWISPASDTPSANDAGDGS